MIDEYYQYLQNKGDKPETIEWHRQKLAVFQQYLYQAGSVPVDSRLINDFLQYRKQSGSSHNTISGDLRCLKALFKWAQKTGHMSYNPAADIHPIKPEPCKQAPFTPAEIAKIIDTLNYEDWESKRNMAIILFMYDTGIRVTALTNIKCSELDLENKRVFVTDKFSKKRWLAWGNRTNEALSEYYIVRPNGHHNDYFFINRRNQKMSRSGIFQMFRKTLQLADIPHRKLHMLRASYACQFLVAGGPDRQWQLQLAMGLADDSQIRNVYARTVMDDMTMAAMRELSPGDRIPV